jgi:hypothetical protein
MSGGLRTRKAMEKLPSWELVPLALKGAASLSGKAAISL